MRTSIVNTGVELMRLTTLVEIVMFLSLVMSMLVAGMVWLYWRQRCAVERQAQEVEKLLVTVRLEMAELVQRSECLNLREGRS